MNMVDVRNKVHRSGFDKSQRNCFTAKVGEILPVLCEEILPGDVWSIDMREFMRTAPVQTASFGRVRQYYDFYFVPYNLLWDKFDAFIVQTKNQFHSKGPMLAADDFTSHPYLAFNDLWNYINALKVTPDNFDPYYDTFAKGANVNMGDWAYYGTTKLLSYLGYPVTNVGQFSLANVALNPFPLLAYQKIYQDYFRFSQWEDAAPWTYNLDYILSNNQLKLDISSYSTESANGIPTMFSLRYCNFDKDMLNGVLPSPQYGDVAIAGPLSGNGYVSTPNILDGVLTLKDVSSWADLTSPNAHLLIGVDNGQFGRQIVRNVEEGDPRTYTQNARLNVSSAKPDATFSQNLGLSVLLLRQAEALQKWKEITMSGDQDYKTQLEKHWNVKISNDNSYMCQYLGGMANNIDISEVINTNILNDDDKAHIAGKGISASDGHINFKSHQYGILMCVYHSKPIGEWNGNATMPRLLTKTKATDYAIPELDSVGMESVLAYQMFTGFNNPFRPLGYAPRYIDYKTSIDVVHGEFLKTLQPWVILRDYSQPTAPQDVTYRWFKVNVNVLDNMFGLNATWDTKSDQFYCTCYFDAKAVRNLDRNGLPY